MLLTLTLANPLSEVSDSSVQQVEMLRKRRILVQPHIHTARDDSETCCEPAYE